MTARSADASVDIAVSVLELSRGASAVAIAVPVEQRTEWQSKRIVTLTRLRVSRYIEGSAAGTDVVVRTLGGRVGEIAQHVDGEPKFELGKPSLIFLRRLPNGVVTVVFRAQGHFPLVAGADGRLTVQRSPSLGKLVHRPRREFPTPALSAAVVLHRAGLEAAESAIKSAWRNAHAR